MSLRTISAMTLIIFGFAIAHASNPTLDSIRKAGALTCGIDQSEAEFSITDEHGSRVAFDRDFCTAIEAAILGPKHQVIIRGYPDEDTALKALRSGEIDIVASVSDDFTHSTLKNVALTRPVLDDWQGFMIARATRVAHARALSGRKICFLSETETEVNLRSWFVRQHLDFVPFPFQEEGEMEAAFVTGNCIALAGDATRLANTRVAFGQHAKDFILLPDAISQDPLASAYRADDVEFGNIVRWTLEVLLLAEELHVTKKNIATLKSSEDPAINRLLDKSHSLGRPLGLDDGWTVHLIEAVGNYGEIFQRDLGIDSPLRLPRPHHEGNGAHPLPLK